jgi:hypothetical protein
MKSFVPKDGANKPPKGGGLIAESTLFSTEDGFGLCARLTPGLTNRLLKNSIAGRFLLTLEQMIVDGWHLSPGGEQI